MGSAAVLPAEIKQQLEELRALSDKAEQGDKEARQELRRILRESAPEVVDKASNFARRGQRIVAETMSAGEPLMQEALMVRMERMRLEIAGENPTPLEVLLTERVVSLWLLVEALETLTNAQLKRGLDSNRRTTPSYLQFIFRWQENTHRRYLAAIRELARVRKLQANTPAVQYNTQINLQ